MSTTARGTALDLIPVALDRFGDRVLAVGEARWDAPTPCAEWSVRDLVNHMTSEHLWAPHLLAGETMEQVGDRYDGDVVGSEPVEAWARAGATSRTAWRSVDPDATVHLSFGESPVTEYAEQMLLDLTVHGWDLARGAGQDETMDRAEAERGLAYARANADMLAGAGLFDAPVDTDADDPGSQLLALLGRRP